MIENINGQYRLLFNNIELDQSPPNKPHKQGIRCYENSIAIFFLTRFGFAVYDSEHKICINKKSYNKWLDRHKDNPIIKSIPNPTIQNVIKTCKEESEKISKLKEILKEKENILQNLKSENPDKKYTLEHVEKLHSDSLDEIYKIETKIVNSPVINLKKEIQRKCNEIDKAITDLERVKLLALKMDGAIKKFQSGKGKFDFEISVLEAIITDNNLLKHLSQENRIHKKQIQKIKEKQIFLFKKIKEITTIDKVNIDKINNEKKNLATVFSEKIEKKLQLIDQIELQLENFEKKKEESNVKQIEANNKPIICPPKIQNFQEVLLEKYKEDKALVELFILLLNTFCKEDIKEFKLEENGKFIIELHKKESFEKTINASIPIPVIGKKDIETLTINLGKENGFWNKTVTVEGIFVKSQDSTPGSITFDASSGPHWQPQWPIAFSLNKIELDRSKTKDPLFNINVSFGGSQDLPGIPKELIYTAIYESNEKIIEAFQNHFNI